MPIINRDRTQTDSHYRYKMPSIEVKYEGFGQYTKTFITNLKKIADALSTTPEILNHFLAVEIGTGTDSTGSNSSDNSELRIFLRGTRSVETLQDNLDKYIKLYVKCTECDIPEGKFRVKGNKKNKKLWVFCPSCGNQQDVTSVHKTSNYIKNNWNDENLNQDEIDAGIDHESKKKNLNLKIETLEDEETEWTISELENTENSNYSFQLPGMEMDGFQLPSYNQGFELPTSSLGINLNQKINNDVQKETQVILEYPSEDMLNDFNTSCNLIEKQAKVRRSLFMTILEQIIGIYKNTISPRFGPKTLKNLKKITEKLDLDFEVAALMVTYLFDRKIIEESQIENYKYLLEPFMCDPTSQQNFLNRLLVLVNQDPELISHFQDTIQNLYLNNLVDDYSLVEWYQTLITSDLSNDLGINTDLASNIFEILTPFISKIHGEYAQEPWENGISFDYQKIQIIRPMKSSSQKSKISGQMLQQVTILNSYFSDEERSEQSDQQIEISEDEDES